MNKTKRWLNHKKQRKKQKIASRCIGCCSNKNGWCADYRVWCYMIKCKGVK